MLTVELVLHYTVKDRYENVVRVNYEDGIFTFFHSDDSVTTELHPGVVRIYQTTDIPRGSNDRLRRD